MLSVCEFRCCAAAAAEKFQLAQLELIKEPRALGCCHSEATNINESVYESTHLASLNVLCRNQHSRVLVAQQLSGAKVAHSQVLNIYVRLIAHFSYLKIIDTGN